MISVFIAEKLLNMNITGAEPEKEETLGGRIMLSNRSVQ
jgi:hypothetical protein